MKKTKRCPYCGEEILAIAKKCKHCGEWLEEKSPQIPSLTSDTELKEKPAIENIASGEDEKTLSKNIPLSNIAIQCLFWVSIIGLVITTAHGLIQEGEMLNTSIGAGKTRIIMATLNFFSTIPEWIGLVLEAFGIIVLLLTTRQAMSNMRQSFDKLFEWLVFATGASTALLVLIDFMDNGIAIALASFLFMLIQMILQIILGIKISTAYTGSIDYLGKVMSICGGVELLLVLTSICSGMFVEDEESLYWINLTITNVEAIVCFYYYFTLKTLLIHPEGE